MGWDGMGLGGVWVNYFQQSTCLDQDYRITQASAPAESVTAEGRSTILRSPCRLEFTSTVHLTWKHVSESGNRGMSNMVWFQTRNHLSTQIYQKFNLRNFGPQTFKPSPKKNGPCFDLPPAATAAHLCTELHQNILQGFVGSIHHQEFQHQVERVDLEEGLHIDRVSQARHLLYLTGCIQMNTRVVPLGIHDSTNSTAETHYVPICPLSIHIQSTSIKMSMYQTNEIL